MDGDRRPRLEDRNRLEAEAERDGDPAPREEEDDLPPPPCRDWLRLADRRRTAATVNARPCDVLAAAVEAKDAAADGDGEARDDGRCLPPADMGTREDARPIGGEGEGESGGRAERGKRGGVLTAAGDVTGRRAAAFPLEAATADDAGERGRVKDDAGIGEGGGGGSADGTSCISSPSSPPHSTKRTRGAARAPSPSTRAAAEGDAISKRVKGLRGREARLDASVATRRRGSDALATRPSR
jgi:hypothetical protein